MSETQNIASMLADQLERLLAAEVDREALFAIEAGEFPTALWAQIDDIGVTRALLPEHADGAGLGWIETEAVLRTLGRHASPVPVGETLIASALLAKSGMKIPNGPLAIISETMQLGNDDRISGVDGLVAWAPAVSFLVAEARRDGQRFCVLVQRDATELSALSTYGRIPSASVVIDAVRPDAISAAQGPDLRSALAVLRSAQIAGALQEVLALCIEYANTRQQFGKPIGKFQAIQQHLAELALQTAATQVAVLYGCRCLDSGNGRRGAAVAKIRASTAAGIGAKIAHQIFGAIGITDEHRLHYYTRRLWQWRGEAGSEHTWAEELGSATLSAGGAMLWDDLVR